MTEEPGQILKWRLSVAETFAFGVTLISVTLWLQQNFQSKADAVEWKTSLETRMTTLEGQMLQIKESANKIAVDVSYIRGRLEPKAK